ncbi:NUDIX domain-containing protein, partial [Thermosporothrix hazakensis]
MAIRRPHDRLLTFTKTFYPQGVYRLLTGGVEFHETVLEALHREVYEETGLQASVERFLACISYHAEEDKDSAIRFTKKRQKAPGFSQGDGWRRKPSE